MAAALGGSSRRALVQQQQQQQQQLQQQRPRVAAALFAHAPRPLCAVRPVQRTHGVVRHIGLRAAQPLDAPLLRSEEDDDRSNHSSPSPMAAPLAAGEAGGRPVHTFSDVVMVFGRLCACYGLRVA